MQQLSVIQGGSETKNLSQPLDSTLPREVVALKLSANSEFESENFSKAIELYNIAISRYSNIKAEQETSRIF